MEREYDRMGDFVARLDRIESEQRRIRSFVTRAYWHVVDRLDALTLPGRRLTCPICERSETREDLELRNDVCMFGGGRLERYVCPGCGCIYGPAKCLELDPELLAADYSLLYTDYSEADSTDGEFRVFQSMTPRLDVPYLNWGCGRWSESIGELRSQGYDVWGYEPTLGAEVMPFVVSNHDQITGRFAGIFSHNVIEHLVHPIEEFRFMHDILLPKGLMAHASPCYKYAYGFSRFHVIFLTGDSPHILAERTGFRVIEQEEDGEFINYVFQRE